MKKVVRFKAGKELEPIPSVFKDSKLTVEDALRFGEDLLDNFDEMRDGVKKNIVRTIVFILRDSCVN